MNAPAYGPDPKTGRGPQIVVIRRPTDRFGALHQD